MDAEPDGEVEDDADHRCGDRRQGGGQQPLAAQRLDVGRPEEDPEEAGHEGDPGGRSEEHTSELQSLMRTSYAVFCLKKKKLSQENNQIHNTSNNNTHN